MTKRLNQKIGLVLFPIWGAGGLATDVAHYRRIFKDADHECDFWEIRYSDKLHKQQHPLKLGTGADGPTAKQGYLSITDKNLASTIKVLNRYDILMFLHPCPHVTDTQKAVKNWPALYTDTKVDRKIVRFTDVYLDKLYPWILDVKDTFEPWATNMGQVRYVRQFVKGCKLSTYPMAFRSPSLCIPKPGPDLVWPCAWRGWKGIKQFINALPDFTGTYELYGSGRELRQFRKAGNPIVQQAKGVVRPNKMLKAFERARFSVDLTGWSKKYYGHNNRSVIEPMFHGAVSVVLDTMVFPHNEIPPEVTYIADRLDLADSLNEAIDMDETNRRQIANEAMQWARWRYNPVRVLEETLFGEFKI